MKLTESDLEREVRHLITRYGLYGYHAPDSRRMAPGMPDWVIIGPRGIRWRELKSPYGLLSARQRHVGYLLLRAGADWGVWRPLDLQLGTIGTELAAIA